MRVGLAASFVSLLMLIPVACVQAAAADMVTPAVSAEDMIARMLALILTSAGVPAAVVASLSTLVVLGCRAIGRIEPMEFRVRTAKREFLFQISVDPPTIEPPTPTRPALVRVPREDDEEPREAA